MEQVRLWLAAGTERGSWAWRVECVPEAHALEVKEVRGLVISSEPE